MIFSLSPLTKKRLKIFRKKRRASVSFFLFSVLCIVSVLTPIICNQKPILVINQKKIFFPFQRNYTEKDLGGSLDILADFRDPEFHQLLQSQGAFILTPPIPYGPNTVNYAIRSPAPPSADNWLGTDDEGHDILTRLLYGLRTSLLFGLLLTLITINLGIFMGALQGYFGGFLDLIGQRFTEIWSSLPILFILIALSSFATPSFLWLLGIMMLFSWMGLASLVRAEFFRTRSLDYVKAAHVLGVHPLGIMYRHMLPNAMVATFTYIPFILNRSIALLASLNFLGFGLPSSMPSLGKLLQQGKNTLHAPWIGLSAFVALTLLLTLITFIGEGLRDTFDPKAE